MKKSASERLNEIEGFLWASGGVGASLEQVKTHLGLKSKSYVSGLLNQLVAQGRATEQVDILNRRRKTYYAAFTSIVQVQNIQGKPSLYKPMESWTFDNHHCFLCGSQLDSDNRADEHVIPRWLQGKYDLWNQEIGLLGESIKSSV